MRSKEDLLGFTACEGMADDGLERLHAALEWRELAAGERLFEADDPGNRLYFLFEGSVSIVMRRDGREEVLAVLEAPSLIGEMGAVLDQPRSAAAVAMSNAVTGELTRETLVGWIDGRRQVALRLVFNILRIMATRIRRVNAKLFELGESEQVGAKVRAELTEFRQKLFTTWSF